MRKNVAVILAGGSGSRFGSDVPKQFSKLAGKAIIEHTIDVFEAHPLIDEICVVIKKEWKYKVEELRISNKYLKLKKVLSGGKERKDSSLSAIHAYAQGESVNLIFHDAVRPFVNAKIINDVVDALVHHNAVDVAIPATDTIIQVANDNIQTIPDRSKMMQGQTPQAFKLETIRDAYLAAEHEPDFVPTDDCGVVKKYLPEEPIFVVKGSLDNIKVTHKQDLTIADRLFQLRSTNNSRLLNESDYKNQLNGKVVVVFGGAYGIGADIVRLAQGFGAKTLSFSRSTTNSNVVSVSDVKRDLALAHAQYGKIDYVVNTASVLVKEPLELMEYSQILDTVNINYLGAINVAKESLKYLEATSGQILNFTSSSFTRGRANYALYSSSKAAIVNLTQALAEEFLVSSNVRINCINPQRTLTPMRTSNFGYEDPSTLLSAEKVAYVAINTLLASFSGQVVDVVLGSDDE